MFAELTLRFIFGFMLEAEDFLSVCLDLYVFYVCVCVFFGGDTGKKREAALSFPPPPRPPPLSLPVHHPVFPGVEMSPESWVDWLSVWGSRLGHS